MPDATEKIKNNMAKLMAILTKPELSDILVFISSNIFFSFSDDFLSEPAHVIA